MCKHKQSQKKGNGKSEGKSGMNLVGYPTLREWKREIEKRLQNMTHGKASSQVFGLNKDGGDLMYIISL